MEADPSGEEECCVGNIDIHFVSVEPAYWDGTLQVLTRNENQKSGYNITGGKYVRTGMKVQIHTLAISEILGDPKAIIEYSQVGDAKLAEKYKEVDDQTREQYKKNLLNLEWILFKEWFRDRGSRLSGDPVDESAAWEFFKKNIDPSAPMPTEKTQNEIDGKCMRDSYNNRRKLQWDLTINIEVNGTNWNFSQKN